MFSLTTATLSMVATLFPDLVFHAEPQSVPFGTACSPRESLDMIARTFDPEEFFIAERVQSDGMGNFVLYGSNDHRFYTLLYQPTSENPNDYACVVGISKPLEGERDARN